MAEAATKTVHLIADGPIRAPTVHPTADRTNARDSKTAYIRGTITTNGDTFTVNGLKNIVDADLFYEGAAPVTALSWATATNVITVTATNGTVIHGIVKGF